MFDESIQPDGTILLRSRPPGLEVARRVAGRQITLTVRYTQQLLLRTNSRRLLTDGLLQAYQKTNPPPGGGPPFAVIVKVESPVAGSALSRALFKLWERVTGDGGEVICANYPPQYIDMLLAMGLPQMQGFKLAADEREAELLVPGGP
jgi:hypothetical protein